MSGSETLACARLWGVSEADLRRAVTSACAGDAEIECQRWPEQIAAIKPPFSLY